MQGIDWGEHDGIPSFTLPSTRYNSQNYFILDLFTNGTFSIVDLSKNRGGSRCSDYVRYDSAHPSGIAISDHKGHDLGNCGHPETNEEDTWKSMSVKTIDDFPDINAFNPERSCRSQLADGFLTACSGSSIDNCCSVIERAVWPRSSAPFSACFCQNEFWEVGCLLR